MQTYFKSVLLVFIIVVLAFTTACSTQEASTSKVQNADQTDKQAAEPAVAQKEEPKQDEVVEIQFLHSHAGDPVNDLIEAYNSSQNKVVVKPIFVQNSYEGVVEKIQAMAVAKQLPDVVANGFVYTRFAIDTLPVTSLQKFIDKEQYDLSDFFPSMLALGKSDTGEQMMLPFAVSTPLIYYNADHFREVGLDPENPPTTWDELRAAAKTLTKDNRYGIYFNYTITGNWLYQAMVETAGGQMMAPDLKGVAFDSKEGRQALQYWVDLVNTDKSMPLLDSKQSTQSFLSGNTSMYVTTTAALTGFREQADFDLRAAVFPTVNDKKRVVPGGGNNLMILAQDEKKQEAAWDFIKFATSAKGTTMIAQSIGYMVSRKSPLEQADLMGDFLKEHPTATVTYEQVDDMVAWYNFPGSSGSKVYKIVQDNIQAALLQQKTTDQAITDAATQSNELLK